MYHSSHPLPSPLGQWGPSWLDLSAFAKQPDPSWFDYPSNPHPSSRRRSYPRLEHTLPSPSTSRHPHSSRTRAHPHPYPLRVQVAPALSALPPLPISLPMPGLEREYSAFFVCTSSDLHSARLLSIYRVPLGSRIADVNGSATHTCPGVSPCGVQRSIIGTQTASISTPCIY